MKKNLLYLFSVLCVFGLFTACSNDDDMKPLGTELDGVYKGALNVTLNDTPIPGDIPQKVYITKVGENQVKMDLKNFSFGPMSLGDISIDKCSVANNGEQWILTGEQSVTLPAPINECVVRLTGSITGSNINMVIDVDAGTAGLVKVAFKGAKMAADQSSEAKITEFTFSSNLVLSQPAIAGTSITFVVSNQTTSEQLATLVPTIKISAGAKISPESGKAQDFSKAVTYTVTSEDGIVTTTYTVTVAESTKFSFEEWVMKKDPSTGSDEQYEIPVGTWGTTNDGILTLNYMFGATFGKFEYPVAPTSDAKGGAKAVSIKTLYTFLENDGMDINAAFGGLIPYVTAGSIFQGTFKTDMGDILNSTKFGVPFDANPTTFSGWYKYTPGKIYYSNKNKIVDTKDQCAIYALLYEELLDKNGNNIPLNGTTIKDSDRIILEARLKDGGEKTAWTKFEIPFTSVKGRVYNASKKYYITFVCTSSFEGDTYNGAPGSLLLVDEFEIVSE